MYAPVTVSLLPVRIVFLARQESAVRMDAMALRSLGATGITHISQSGKALAFLEEQALTASFQSADNAPDSTPGKKPLPGVRSVAQNSPNVVICDETLEDMSALAFLYAMAKNASLQTRPVLVLTGSAAVARHLRGVGAYVLERPYSLEQLSRMLSKAASPARRVLRPEAFEQLAGVKGVELLHPELKKARRIASPGASPPAPLTTSDWLAKASRHLLAGESEQAGQAFSRVLARQEDHVEACLGLARVHMAREDKAGMRRYLLRAAAASLRRDDKVQAARIAALLPSGMRGHIFVNEAAARLEEGEFRAAALGFLDAGKETPSVPLHSLMARACQLTSNPEEKLRNLCDAYEHMGQRAMAQKLRRRLLEYPSVVPADEPPSWLDKFPAVKEMLSVASYSAWAWRQA